jgi:hypothetical protein
MDVKYKVNLLKEQILYHNAKSSHKFEKCLVNAIIESTEIKEIISFCIDQDKWKLLKLILYELYEHDNLNCINQITKAIYQNLKNNKIFPILPNTNKSRILSIKDEMLYLTINEQFNYENKKMFYKKLYKKYKMSYKLDTTQYDVLPLNLISYYLNPMIEKNDKIDAYWNKYIDENKITKYINVILDLQSISQFDNINVLKSTHFILNVFIALFIAYNSNHKIILILKKKIEVIELTNSLHDNMKNILNLYNSVINMLNCKKTKKELFIDQSKKYLLLTNEKLFNIRNLPLSTIIWDTKHFDSSFVYFGKRTIIHGICLSLLDWL